MISNKTVCDKCAGDKNVDGRMCTKCCGIGIKYSEPRPLSFNQVAFLRVFASMNGWPREFTEKDA